MSTMWRTTSRAAHPSHGDGFDQPSTGAPSTMAEKSAATER